MIAHIYIYRILRSCIGSNSFGVLCRTAQLASFVPLLAPSSTDCFGGGASLWPSLAQVLATGADRPAALEAVPPATQTTGWSASVRCSTLQRGATSRLRPQRAHSSTWCYRLRSGSARRNTTWTRLRL